MVRLGFLVAVISCGGTPITPHTPHTPHKESPRKPVTCTDHWLTVDKGIIDLVVERDRVVWLEFEGGAIATASRVGDGGEVLHPPTAGEQGHQLSIAGDKVAWVHYDDSIWKLDGGKSTQLATIEGLTQLEARPDGMIAGGTNGIVKLSWSGESEEVFTSPIWTMRVDGDVAVVQSGDKLLRVPLDGEPPVTLVDKVPKLSSLTLHDGKMFAMSRPSVLVVEGDQLVPFVTVEVRHGMWNLTSANGRLYFTVGNVVYQLRDRTPVPIVIAHEVIGDLEIAGEAIYAWSNERTGARAFCHAVDGDPIALPPPAKRECEAAQRRVEHPSLDLLECKDAAGVTVSSQSFHRSGTLFRDVRDNIERTFYADGTPRSEEPSGKAGAVKRWFVNGKLREEGLVDEAGENDGTWRYYRPNGGVRETIDWSHGTAGKLR